MSTANVPAPRFAAARGIALPREAVLLALLVIECIVLSMLSPYFLNSTQLLETSRYFVETGLVALGMTLIIIIGGIDLSVGSVLALSSVTLGFGYDAGLPLGLAIVASLACATLAGGLNGVLSTRWDVHPLAVTVATMALYRGIAEAVTNQDAVSTFPHSFDYFGQFYLGQIPGQLIAFAVVACLMWLLLERSRFGRYVYAIGTNEDAARFSGVPVLRIKTIIYSLTGLLVGIAALIYTSRVSTARADAGLGFELGVIASVVLGGASIYGGVGTIQGTVLGGVIIAILQQGLVLTDLDSNWILVITGLVMMIGVFFNEFFRRQNE